MPVFTLTALVTADPAVTSETAVDHPDTLVALPVMLLIVRVAVVADLAVSVGATTSRKFQLPDASTGRLAVNAPAPLVASVEIVDQVVSVDALRCTSTVRATNPVPVLTVTARVAV